MSGPPDIRRHIFAGRLDQALSAVLLAETAGVVSGLERARDLAQELGLGFASSLRDGQEVAAGGELARLTGNPLQLTRAEELLIGALSKASGIATAARRAQRLAGPRLRVVAGGVKKMPPELKDLVRRAIEDGGAAVRMAEHPFVYLDKNYVHMLGGIKQALQAAEGLPGSRIIQVRGETEPIAQEAIEAARAGAGLIMVDTGARQDAAAVSRGLRQAGLRGQVQVAFAGEISLADLPDLAKLDLDAVDIGYAIVDAPCLPMRLDLLREA
ncbi:MAG: quinolinate phosphoribosyl transferase [Desulfarculus sp.]|nr:MAG: quinolinate phosphoribosyl transferase [Desulfarculus sp.]